MKLESVEDEDEGCWKLTVGCNLPGKWILHWGVNYVDDVGRLVWFGLEIMWYDSSGLSARIKVSFFLVLSFEPCG